MLAPRFMGCCPRIPRAEEGARGGKKRISNEKRERERGRPSENKNRMREATARGGGERPFECWCSFSESLLIISEREGRLCNFNPRAIFYAIPSPIILYLSRQPLNNNYLHTHSTAIINLRRDSIIGEEKEA